MEHLNTYEQEGDAVTWAEANMWVYRYGEISHTPAVSKTYSCYTRISSQQGRTCIIQILCKMWYARQPERGDGKRDTVQSDARLVPVKQLKDCGGKKTQAKTTASSFPRTWAIVFYRFNEQGLAVYRQHLLCNYNSISNTVIQVEFSKKGSQILGNAIQPDVRFFVRSLKNGCYYSLVIQNM